MKQNKFFSYFAERTKISMRKVRTAEDVWHIFISRGNLILALIGAIIAMFVLVLVVVSYTPILDFAPGYPGKKAKEVLVGSIERLDSLEREMAMWENYTTDLRMILDGQQPVVVQLDSLRQKGAKGEAVAKNQYDAALRAEMTDTTIRRDKKRNAELTFEMIAPVQGAVEQNFAPAKGVFGVMVKTEPDDVALAVLDGTLVVNSWNPEWGAVVVVQHAAGMMSIYKGLARALGAVGDRVKAGQGVGMVKAASAGRAPLLYFELWNSGNAVDPENYITF